MHNIDIAALGIFAGTYAYFQIRETIRFNRSMRKHKIIQDRYWNVPNEGHAILRDYCAKEALLNK